MGWNPSFISRTTCCPANLHLFFTLHCNFLVATDILYLKSLLIDRVIHLLYNLTTYLILYSKLYICTADCAHFNFHSAKWLP